MAIAEPNVMIPPAIQRSADHRYTYEGETYPGVTSILDVLDKSGPLMGWAARQTAEAAVRMTEEYVSVGNDGEMSALEHLIATVGRNGTISALTARKNWTNETAKLLGTDVHEMAQLVVEGKPTPAMAEPTRKRVLHYAAWWKNSGWTLRLAEAMVVFPTHRYGGTFDLLCYGPDGETVLADIKTGGKWGRKAYNEEVLQVTAYGLAPIVAPMGSPTAYPMPKVDRYALIHVTAEGVKEIEVHVGTPERMAWLAAIDLHSWVQSMKGKTF